MNLDEFNKVVTEASQAAHLFIADGYTFKRVRSVSLRIDDDGVLSILLHPKRMENRVETDESLRLGESLKQLGKLFEQAPELKHRMQDFHEFYIHWDQISVAIEDAGLEFDPSSETIEDFFNRTSKEQYDLRKKLAELESQLIPDCEFCGREMIRVGDEFNCIQKACQPIEAETAD